jgi:hypothetical protein
MGIKVDELSTRKIMTNELASEDAARKIMITTDKNWKCRHTHYKEYDSTFLILEYSFEKIWARCYVCEQVFVTERNYGK